MPTIPSKDTFTDTVEQQVEYDTIFKNQMVNVPAKGTKAVFSVVFSPLDADGAWIPNKEKLYRFEDDSTVPVPVLATLATELLLMQLTAKVNLAHPYVARLVAYAKTHYNVEITEDMTLSDAAKLLKPIMPLLNEEQEAARPAPSGGVPLPPSLP